MKEVIEKVIKLLLKIYRRQEKVPDYWFEKYQFQKVDQAKFHIYQLLLKYSNKQRKRNISIKPLGEEGRSKSSVFLVKYDDNIVIKIPPVTSPITNLAEFLDKINKENIIKERFKPGIAIVPDLTIIMKKISGYNKFSDMSTQKAELSYTKSLEAEPKLQEYFQINNSFAFFLDLSSYHLAIDVINNIIQAKNYKINEVLTSLIKNIKYLDLIEQEFGSSFFPLHEWTGEFIASVQALVSDRYLAESELAEVFYRFLANKKMKADDKVFNLSSETIKEINVFLENYREKSVHNIKTLIKIIERQIFRDGSWSEINTVESLILKKLELLSYLEKKGLVIKDLKSDGILIIPKDPTVNFMKAVNMGEFDFGLLDVEYAVFWKDRNEKLLPINQLDQSGFAYTAYIGTLSHIYPNSILSETLGDPGRILKLQDWYAAISFIYQVASLYKFVKSPRLFSETGFNLNQLIKKANEKAGKLLPSEIFKELSLDFWNVALEEFFSKLENDKKFFVKESIVLPEAICSMFIREIEAGMKDISHCIRNLLGSNKQINNKKRNFLIQCNSSQIKDLLKKWGKKKKNEGVESIVSLLKNLLPLRKNLERRARIKLFFTDKNVTITVYQLLRTMFSLVCNGMYRKEWGELQLDIKPSIHSRASNDEIKKTVEATVNIDITKKLNRSNFDGFVKSPFSVFRFISLSLQRTISTPYDTKFARSSCPAAF